MAKKYLEVFNDGSQDLYILDKEAQDAIGCDTSMFVDLGLPSGTLWAKCNIGATEETGYGNYYMYGKGDREYIYRDAVYAGTEDPLAAEADTATVILGTPWHMPTLAQFEEFVANTTFSWQSNFNNSGINGAKFTAQNGNYIFLPAVGKITDNQKYNVGNEGNYWSSTPGNSVNARSFNFGNNGTAMPNYYRSIGYAVRPVCNSAPLNKVAPDKVFKGATSSAAGERGLVPAPAAGDGNKYLRGDGTWSDDHPSAAFIGDALVFYSGGVFDGETLIVG